MIAISKSALLALALCVATFAIAADSSAPLLLPPAESASPGMVYVATLSNGFSLRFDHRRAFQDTSRLYVSAAEDSYVDIPTDQIVALTQEQLPPPPPAPARQTADLNAAVNAASDKHSIDADLIDSVIRAESDFNPKAVSPKGARGLMQLMPATAQRLGVQDSFDAQANVDAGSRYLRELLARYNNDLARALAAYNAGAQRVEQYHGVPPYHETRAYVARVIRDFNRKKLSQKKSAPPHAPAARKSLTSAPSS